MSTVLRHSVDPGRADGRRGYSTSCGIACLVRISYSGATPLGSSRHFPVSMDEVTTILSAIENGDPHAAEQLLPLVYDELRKIAAQQMAQEKPGQTLQATALVHEAYLRLVANPGSASREPESGDS